MAVNAISQQYVRTTNVTVTNTDADTPLLSPAGFNGSRTFSANTLKIGDTIILRAWGYVSTGNNPGTLNLYLKCQNNTVAASGTLTLPANSVHGTWEFYVILTARDADWTAASIFNGSTILSTMNNGDQIVLDRTSDATFEMTARFSVADANNVLKLQVASMEYMPSP